MKIIDIVIALACVILIPIINTHLLEYNNTLMHPFPLLLFWNAYIIFVWFIGIALLGRLIKEYQEGTPMEEIEESKETMTYKYFVHYCAYYDSTIMFREGGYHEGMIELIRDTPITEFSHLVDISEVIKKTKQKEEVSNKIYNTVIVRNYILLSATE